MFTGIVESVGTVTALRQLPGGRRLTVEVGPLDDGLSIGASVAVNGCCLTVIERLDHTVAFEAGPETLRCTNLGGLKPRDRVNLERAMPPDGRFGGHLVQGHVDGVATVRSRRPMGEFEIFSFTTDRLVDELVPKGSVAIDGVSLTLVDVAQDGFEIMLIPHTLSATTLGERRSGAIVNVETDIVGKYVRRFLSQSTEELTVAKLRGAGFVE